VSLIKIHCKENPINLTDQEWQLLADKTEGYSGSDIANAVLEAMFQPIRMMQNAQYWKHTEGCKATVIYYKTLCYIFTMFFI